MEKVSWVILTFNRSETVKRAFEHNLKASGRPIDELIWVDNGSTDDVRQFMQAQNPDVSILNAQNLGVAKGYNRGIVLATGSHVVITGCDRLMPAGWLKTFEEYFDTIPETGAVSCYSCDIDRVPERHRSAMKLPEVRNGLHFIRAMPMGAKCFRRDLLAHAGHLREDFGLYGWEDVEWGYRLERVCDEKKLLYYTIPGFVAEHLGNEGVKEFNGNETPTYHAFKQKEANDPRKHALMEECRQKKFPYYTPYV